MNYIPLQNSVMHALIDESYYEELSQYNWYVQKHGRTYRAFRSEYERKDGKKINQKTIYLHRSIMKPKKRQMIDHIDGNGLNNRRSNLRLCTHQQNCCNRPLRTGSFSGAIGVKWNRRIKRWKAYVSISKKRLLIGNYINKYEAILARNVSASFAYGEFARI